jgi:3,4-dihydroxy-9,10-secoandrosta-1,3,5(10)-triene-9,17-dione 4,5-dioxygenase
MDIRGMGYAVIEATDMPKWRSFGTDMLGMMPADGPDGALYLKMDDRAYRMLVVPGSKNRLIATGWEVATEEDFNAARDQVTKLGAEVTAATPTERAQRKVQDFFSFKDPSGNRHEVFWGPISDFARFASPIGVRGFVTGRLGMGHSVLPALNYDATLDFWRKAGFGVSDYLNLPMPNGQTIRLAFMHCNNPRQHSLALVEMPDPSDCIHLMLEVESMDEVGFAYDRAQKLGVPLQCTLGRHVNDDMFSFYMYTPAGFAIEYGAGGKQVEDWSQMKVFETTRGSHWGHSFVKPPPGAAA